MKSLSSLILLALMVFACTEHKQAFVSAATSSLSRSSKVTVINNSNKDFTLFATFCKRGGFLADMFPENEQPMGATTEYGIQASGVMKGVNCKVTYTSLDGAWFELQVNIPYLGRNKIQESHSENLKISHVSGQGKNNQVRFVIRNAEIN